jgi:CRP-like cAMP-binding protein
MMSAKLDKSFGNQVLDSLLPADSARILPHLQCTNLKLRLGLETAGRPITSVYFPTSGIISLIAVSTNKRDRAEVGLVGREGMTGLAVILGTLISPFSAFVQMEGIAFSIGATRLSQLFSESSTLRLALLRFVQVFATQIAQTALANSRGNIDRRLARWLLMARDRTSGDELRLTDEFLASTLGVRRAGITLAMQRLVSQGLVAKARGSVTIANRQGLEEATGGLYGVPERELVRLLETPSEPGIDPL